MKINDINAKCSLCMTRLEKWDDRFYSARWHNEGSALEWICRDNLCKACFAQIRHAMRARRMQVKIEVPVLVSADGQWAVPDVSIGGNGAYDSTASDINEASDTTRRHMKGSVSRHVITAWVDCPRESVVEGQVL